MVPPGLTSSPANCRWILRDGETSEVTVSQEQRRNVDERSFSAHKGHKDHKSNSAAVRLAAGGGLPRCTRPQIPTALAPSAACICGLVHRGCRRALHADQSNGPLRSSSFLRCSCETVSFVPPDI